MTVCNCSPPADEIVTTEEGGRVIVLVGGDVGSIPTAILDQARTRVEDETGLPAGLSSYDRRCDHGRLYTELVIFPDRSQQPAARPPLVPIAYFGNAPTAAQGSAYQAAVRDAQRRAQDQG